jgi:DNA-binding transcriptional MerR regulator
MKSDNKKYYTLKQVSKLTDIPIYTLKFWRREFGLHLKESSSGRKIFAQDDIDKLLLIKHLRQQEKLTLYGIKKRIKELKEIPKQKNTAKNKQQLLWLQKELLAIKTLLLPSSNKE